uniref:Uncharacterized protein n=1 Tax=Nymphaea colorata TaxID=210225 RepID=A0A5K1A3V5_9MAGN
MPPGVAVQAVPRRRCCSQSCSLLSPAPPSDPSIGGWDPAGWGWRFALEQLGDAFLDVICSRVPG